MGWYRDSLEWVRRRCNQIDFAWKWAGFVIFITALTIWILFSIGYVLTAPQWLSATIATVGGVVIATILAFTGLLIVGITYALPITFSWSLVTALLLVVYAFNGLTTKMAFILAAFLLVPALLVGSSLGLLSRRPRGLFSQLLGTIALVAGLAGFGYIGWWALSDGQNIAMPVNAASTATIVPLELPNPSLRGAYEVKTLTYGSGKDLHRVHYGSQVTLITPTVDASPFVKDWTGWAGSFRSYYWGFGPDEFPLNARVWLPEGKGPFPLVLIVHGNTLMELPSEDGYAYLAELLASRGYVVASIDENFLNSSWHTLWKGIGRNNARAWMLLQHLNLWRAWNNETNNPFYQKVDMDSIGLIGHSRGGEAVALAAAFNDLPYYPDDCTIAFDFNFGIRAVAAIAPVDGQYLPTGMHAQLHNISYLVMQGSYDSDVRAFQGSSTYERVLFEKDQDLFKASVYIYGANHGQFNTKWGRYDQWPLEAYLLNVKPLLAPEAQRQVAKVYLSAFMESALRGDKGYRELFRDHRSGGPWLPPTIYLTQYSDPSYRYISTFESGLDVTRTDIKGSHQFGEYLSLWRVHEVCLRYGCLDTRAVFLGWSIASQEGTPNFTVQLVDGSIDVDESSSLVFCMADGEESPLPEKDSTFQASAEPIDMTIEVSDVSGNVASLPLSHYSGLQPSLGSRIWKADFLEDEEASEIVFQSFVFRMRDFMKVNPKFVPDDLTRVRFLFNRTGSSVIVLDALGIRPY